eukprot:TRINITY_DN35181_c0_g1_i1.p1 TRINITY_DN35181_c0_g1~~TRINITY_DN35181_c0_g1_i1.p1  ORF type:complete len:324 (+),score=121.83 TRINITY_DN35181_c0_g1_i1:144-974(+)
MAYSAALSQLLAGRATVCGSVLPTHEAQQRLYTSAKVQERESLLAQHGGSAMYAVDCTKAHEHPELCSAVLLGDGFDEVHFNFPHLGYSQQAERGGEWSRAQQHVDFFKKMFASLRHVQPAKGVMRLTLTPTPPYSIKEVKKAAMSSGYVFEEERPFDHRRFQGYHPAWGDDRDLSKPGTSQYGTEGRQLCFRNAWCHACEVPCTGLEQLTQHLLTKKHAIGLRKYAAKRRALQSGEPPAPAPVSKKKKRKAAAAQQESASPGGAPASKRANVALL